MSTAIQPLVVPRNGVIMRARDYAELAKLRVTSLIVMTAWCGYFFGAVKSGVSSFSWGLFHTLVGIALVSAGTAAAHPPGYSYGYPSVLAGATSPGPEGG